MSFGIQQYNAGACCVNIENMIYIVGQFADKFYFFIDKRQGIQNSLSIGYQIFGT